MRKTSVGVKARVKDSKDLGSFLSCVKLGKLLDLCVFQLSIGTMKTILLSFICIVNSLGQEPALVVTFSAQSFRVP